MRQTHSTRWKASKQPRKQRKYLHNAPLHLQSKQLHAHLSKELREKHGTRSLRVRVGDTVKILRGTFKGKEGKVELVDVKNSKIEVAKITMSKLQGGETKYPIRPSNCVLTVLVAEKRRFKGLKNEKTTTTTTTTTPTTTTTTPTTTTPAPTVTTTTTSTTHSKQTVTSSASTTSPTPTTSSTSTKSPSSTSVVTPKTTQINSSKTTTSPSTQTSSKKLETTKQ